ncbi:MAG: hypothetical protein ACI8YQ_000605 [Polaribacter sp.]|jgi:hypothetical protein
MNLNFLRFSPILFFLLINLSVNAQQKDLITWGKQVSNKTKSVMDKIITQDATGFYVLKTRQGNQELVDGPQKVYIEHYNQKMNLTRSKEIKMKWKKKKRQFEDILMIGGELYLFTSFNNQGKRKNFLFAQKMNKRNFEVEDELNFIADIDTKNKYKEGSFNFHISTDSSKVLVLNELPYKKNQPEQFALRVYNNDFTLSWQKDIVLPYNDDKFDIEDYQVDNQGNVYLLGLLYGDGSLRKKRGLPNYQYVLLAYTQMGTEKKKYPINLREKFITDLTFRPSNNGELVFCGFYSESGTYSIRGTYFFRINPITKEVFNKSLKELDFEFRTEYVSNRKKQRMDNDDKKSELYQFSLDELILRNDGGALLIAEQYFVEEVREFDPYYGGVGTFGRYGNNNQYRLSYIYNYNDIIIVNVDPKGEIEWASRIPKRQETENDGGWYSSYSMSIVKDKINFIYNDNGRNFDPNGSYRKNRYNFNGRNSVIAISQVSPDGSVETFPLGENRDGGVITRPKACKQIGPKKVAIYGEYGRTYRFGKLSF